MAVKGIFSSDSGMPGDREPDFAKTVLTMIGGGTAPLFAITSGMRDLRTTATRVDWQEEPMDTGRVLIMDPPVPADTGRHMRLEDASVIVAGAQLMVEQTGEMLIVLAVSGNEITVMRGHGNTPRLPITSSPHHNGYVQIISNAHEEGSLAPLAVTYNYAKRWNYTQIIRNTAELSLTANASQYRGYTAVSKTRMSAMMLHATQIERGYLWSVRDEGTLRGKPFRTMDGLTRQILTNRFICPTSGLSFQMMNNFVETVMAQNARGYPNERIAYCGNRVVTALNDLARHHSEYYITEGAERFGIRVYEWITPHGSLKLMTHPLMNLNPHWQGSMYVFHPGMITKRTLRPTSIDNYDRDGTRQGRDADFSVWTTETCIQYGLELTGALMHGVYCADTTPGRRVVDVYNNRVNEDVDVERFRVEDNAHVRGSAAGSPTDFQHNREEVTPHHEDLARDIGVEIIDRPIEDGEGLNDTD